MSCLYYENKQINKSNEDEKSVTAQFCIIPSTGYQEYLGRGDEKIPMQCMPRDGYKDCEYYNRAKP